MNKRFTARAKLWKIMKVCTVQIVIALTLVGASLARPDYAQVLDRKVTLHLTGVALKDALKEIESATGIKFVYSEDQLNLDEKVSVEAVGLSLGEVLDKLLTPHEIKYKVHEKESTITLKKRNEKEETSLIIPKTGVDTAGVKMTVTGKVTDAGNQQPLAGVNVVIKGTTMGTSSDAAGNFSIVANESDILIFSFIGYATFETPVNARTRIDVEMKEDAKNLNEVVVNAGYYSTTKEFQTGSIVTVEAKDIEKQPVSNPLAALQGRVPGLDITQQTGVPGGNFTVLIRGQNSIANGNDPLYIIDGVPYISSTMALTETSAGILGGGGTSPLNSIDPATIESIEVLKDADATAIYGSRGSNGVILITTKKGKAGKTKIDFNYYSGISKVGRKIDMMNTGQYLGMRHEAFRNDGITPTPANAPDLLAWDTTRYTNWQKTLIGGTAHTTDAQLSISGGDNNTQFSIGGGYHRETAVFPGSNADQRIAAHVNLTNTSPNKKLKTVVSVNYSVNATNLIAQDLTGRAFMLSPDAPPLFDQNGNLNWGANSWNSNYQNPLSYTKQGYESTTNNLISNAKIGYAILPNLEIKTGFGYNNSVMNAVTTTPVSSLDPAVAQLIGNTAAFSSSSFQNWIAEPQLNWKPAIGKSHFDVLTGVTFLEQINEGMAQYGRGFPSEALMKTINAASSITTSTNTYAQYRYNAVFGRINHIIKEKYIINITGRRDGSSRFGPGRQFANFGAIGSAWIFSKEEAVKSLMPFLSFGKLRASYGITGNDQIGNYQYLDTYSPTGSGLYQGNIGLAPQRLYNPDFAWETNKKIEAGLDLGFLNDRIVATVNYYRNRSSNQLVNSPLPATTGFTSIQSNLPATVQNTGLEIVLNTSNIKTQDFTWSTSLNLSVPRNRLIAFPNLDASPEYSNRFVVGQPLGIRKLYQYTRVDPNTGIYQFKDVNGDGNLDVSDQKTIRFVGKNFYGGLLNSFQYKRFEFSFLFQFVKQTGYNYLYYLSGAAPGTQFNQPVYELSRWMKPGDITNVQRFSTLAAYQTAYAQLANSDRAISDASFIRLKNLSFSYSLPQRWITKLKIETIRIFIQGQNLLTLTNYTGLDPENQNSVLPPLRVVTGGVHITL